MIFTRKRYALLCAIAASSTGCAAITPASAPAMIRTSSVAASSDVSPEHLTRMAQRFEAQGKTDKAQRLYALAQTRAAQTPPAENLYSATPAQPAHSFTAPGMSGGAGATNLQLVNYEAPATGDAGFAAPAVSEHVPYAVPDAFPTYVPTEPVTTNVVADTAALPDLVPLPEPATEPVAAQELSVPAAPFGSAITAAANRVEPSQVEPKELVFDHAPCAAKCLPTPGACESGLTATSGSCPNSAPLLCPSAGEEEISIVDCVRKLQDADPKQRSLAAFRLGKLGPAGQAAMPELRYMYENEQDACVKVHIAEAMVRADAECVEGQSALLGFLSSEDRKVRWLAAYSLESCVRCEDSAAITHLTQALRDADPSVRTAAALTLGAFGTRAKSSAPALFSSLQDESTEVRDAAKLSLACLMPELTAGTN